MIEAYAFFAAFAVQILVTSVLLPAWFIRYARTQTTRVPAERLAQLYPDVNVQQALEGYLTRYRAIITVIAVFGVLLFGWLINYMRGPNWDEGKVIFLAALYFLAAQLFPLLLFGWFAVKFNKAHKRTLPETKRTATLRRRGLFDFVPPFVVGFAVLSYLVFAAFIIYLRFHPFMGFAGLINLGAITLVYALNAITIYVVLYGKQKNELQTHTGRLQTMGMTVKTSVYSCILIVIFMSLNFSLRLLDLKSWEPFALSVFFVVCALVSSLGYAAPLRKADSDELNTASN
jgi:type IV secretory pathway VirB2 component (pilin)